MTTLYKLGDDLEIIAQQVQELLDDGADPNSNQIQEMLNEMVGADDEWREKATRVAFYIKNTMADVDAIDDEIKRLTAKKNKLKKSTAYLENTLIAQMQKFDLKEIKNPLLTLSLRQNPPSVLVHNEESVPMDFKKVSYTVDKTAIKRAGGADGCEIVNTIKLVMK